MLSRFSPILEKKRKATRASCSSSCAQRRVPNLDYADLRLVLPVILRLLAARGVSRGAQDRGGHLARSHSPWVVTGTRPEPNRRRWGLVHACTVSNSPARPTIQPHSAPVPLAARRRPFPAVSCPQLGGHGGGQLVVVPRALHRHAMTVPSRCRRACGCHLSPASSLTGQRAFNASTGGASRQRQPVRWRTKVLRARGAAASRARRALGGRKEEREVGSGGCNSRRG